MWCLCALCGVVWSGMCGVMRVVCVWRGLARGKHTVCTLKNVSVCRFTTHPCVPSKTPACVQTCARFASTHGTVLNLHTETFLTHTRGGRKGGGEGVFFSLFLSSLLSFSLPSFSFSSLFLFFLPSLVFSLFSLSNNDNDHSSSRALSVYTRL